MAKDPIIEPANVKLTTAFPSPRSSIVPPATSGGGAPTPVRFSFGPSNVAVVKMDGSVQAGLFAADDRRLCGLEFMQFATPGRFARVYAGVLQGSTTLDFASHIRGREFLDTPTNVTDTSIVPKHGPFMSEKPHRANETRDGHFVNSMQDHPGVGTPDFIVAQNQEKHFLLSVSYVSSFATLLVFLHPTNNRRQPVALVRWTVSYDFSVRWRDGRIASIFGSAKMTPGAVTTQPEAMTGFVARVNNPPNLVINQVVNPALITGLASPLPDADQRFFNPLQHPAAQGSDFWSL